MTHVTLASTLVLQSPFQVSVYPSSLTARVHEKTAKSQTMIQGPKLSWGDGPVSKVPAIQV